MNVPHLINQKSYEKIEYVLRRHPITFIPQVLLFLVLLVLPLAVYLMSRSLFPAIFENQSIYTFAVILGSTYTLGALLLFFVHFIDFYLDMWVLTNDRIVDVEQFGLFSRTISELDLFRIQDVTTDVHGLFATFFRYGNVSVKTASQNLDIIFRNVPNPNKIRQELLRLADIDRKYHYPEVKTDKGANEE